MRYAFVNGEYKPNLHASVHIEDRGYQFGQSVYEVMRYEQGKLEFFDFHYERLLDSCKFIGVTTIYSTVALKSIIRELVRLNRLSKAIVYIQVTRGVQSPRNHVISKLIQPSFVITLNSFPDSAYAKSYANGVHINTEPEMRWKNCHIKTTALIQNVLAKQRGYEAGYYETAFINNEGYVTEGTASNIVRLTGNTLSTYPNNKGVLPGIIRKVLLDYASEIGLATEEKPFTLNELYASDEVYMTASTYRLFPVVRINEVLINKGKVGPYSHKLNQLMEVLALRFR